MLVARNWAFSLALVGSFDPIPSAISVASESPGVEQTRLVSCSTAKTDHHSSGTSGHAKSSRVIDSDLRSLSSTVEFNPRKWSFLDTEAPDVVDSLLAGVASKDQKVRLREDDRVAVPSTRRGANNRNDHPLSLVFTVSHIEQVQVVRGETSAASSSSVHDHLHRLDIGGGMGSSGRRRNTLD